MTHYISNFLGVSPDLVVVVSAFDNSTGSHKVQVAFKDELATQKSDFALALKNDTAGINFTVALTSAGMELYAAQSGSSTTTSDASPDILDELSNLPIWIWGAVGGGIALLILIITIVSLVVKCTTTEWDKFADPDFV